VNLKGRMASSVTARDFAGIVLATEAPLVDETGWVGAVIVWAWLEEEKSSSATLPAVIIWIRVIARPPLKTRLAS